MLYAVIGNYHYLIFRFRKELMLLHPISEDPSSYQVVKKQYEKPIEPTILVFHNTVSQKIYNPSENSLGNRVPAYVRLRKNECIGPRYFGAART